MSDEPGPSTSSRSTEESVDDRRHDQTQSEDLRKKVRALFNKKRVELLEDLIRNLDILVYAQLSIVYYMDCHLFRFILRGMVQFMFLTPKPSAFPRPPKPEPYVGAILGTNILCLILHIFGKTPAASEATRFYLHGGLILDFIGQKGPSSKIILMLLDLFILALQLVNLSAHITRKRLKDGNIQLALSALQDLDSEERGVRRSSEMAQQEAQQGIELQTLSRSEDRGVQGHSYDTWQSTAPRLDSFLLESFWNGQIVLADLNPVKTVQEQIVHYQQTPVEERRSALNAQLAARVSEFRYLTRRR